VVKQDILSLCRQAQSNGCRLERVCDLLGITVRSLQRWERQGFEDKRKGASKLVPRKLTSNEREKILTICCSEQYQDLTPYEIVPILAENGKYVASESTFYRVLKQEGLVASKKPRRTRKDGRPDELKATAVNQLWSWDISYLKTNVRGIYFYLYLFMDIFSRAITGWEINESENGAAAADLFSRLCIEQKSQGVTLHSDNGSPMRSSHMLATLQKLGVVASFSRPSVSNDNPYSESLFKTLKYTAGYPQSFQTIEEARVWMSRFVHWYNNEHRHSRIKYVTPMQRHKGLDVSILFRRDTVFAQARQNNPSRWSSHERSWERPEEVILKRANHQKINEKLTA